MRPAHAADLDQLCALEGAVFPSDRLSRRQFRYHMRNPRAFLRVLAAGGHVLGYALMLYRHAPGGGKTAARLYSIAVSPAAQGQGAGGKLLAAAIRDARAQGADKISLEVRKKSLRVVGLYEHFGFETLRVLPAYYADGQDALRMIRPL
jgi:ribosomal protein S18 acetylase RimI-like enzyme